MSIDELGSIGEFIASIGVIVSLVYLALQTKANTSAVKAQTRSSLTDQVLGIQSQMFQSDSYRIAFQKYMENEELNSLDQDILRREALLFFKHMENAQFQYDSGLYDQKEYEAQRGVWKNRFNSHGFWIDAWDQFGPTMSPSLVSNVQPIVDEARKGSDSDGGV
jgi:hypothetical protein